MVKSKKAKTNGKSLQKQVNVLKKEQKRLKKRNPKQIIKVGRQANFIMDSAGVVTSMVTTSPNLENPITYVKCDARLIVAELTPSKMNFIRVLFIWYLTEIVGGNLVAPAVTDLMELDDAKSSTDFTNRKRIQVFYDTKLRGSVAGALEDASFNIPTQLAFTPSRRFKGGKECKNQDYNDFVWHPYMLCVADDYNTATTVAYSLDLYYYE